MHDAWEYYCVNGYWYVILFLHLENPQQSIYQQLNCSNTSSADCQFQPNGLIYPDSGVL